MSLITMRTFSDALEHETSINILLPLPVHTEIPAGKLPVLYLLHGLGDNYSAWLHKTAIERYAVAAGLAVVMPEGAASAYEHMSTGEDYRTWISRELPEKLTALFPLSDRREDTYIAGCSMGGCGAIKLGLSCPDRYAAIGCFSAAHFEYRSNSSTQTHMLEVAYGDRLNAIEEKIVYDAKAAAGADRLTRMWLAWGDRDALRDNAKTSAMFFESISSPSLRVEAHELQGGHDWALWDRAAEQFIEWLGLKSDSIRRM